MTLLNEGPLAATQPEYANLSHPVWGEIFPEFKPHEFEEPAKMDIHFLRKLHEARLLADVPFRILDSVRGDPRSAHGELPCTAVDLQLLNAYERMRVMRALILVGFTRIGVYPGTSGMYKGMKKKDGGGLHVDGSRSKPSAFWTMKLPKEKNDE